MVTLLGIDLGTTHCKAALFDLQGAVLHCASAATPTRQLRDGQSEHDPHDLWSVTAGLVRTVTSATPGMEIAAVGVAGMAEAGCLLDARTRRPRTAIIPWFDQRSRPQAERLGDHLGAVTLFTRTGLYPSFKHGLAKLLWLRDQDEDVLEDAIWLSVPDWIVSCLTGEVVTDPTLAVRTLAFNLSRADWDEDTLQELHLSRSLFARVRPSGAPAGVLTARAAAETGLPAGATVAVSGHDHICTLLAAGVLEPGPVVDSIGTAESLIGVLDRLRLDPPAADSGLSIVPHVLPDRYCWLGGISASGGSVEWLRAQLDLGESYDEVVALLERTDRDPTGILFFPYLAGSGAPRPDQDVRAAFVGISARDDRGRLLKAVIEGTCFEAESICQAAERLTEARVTELITLGGGARNQTWLQIKADIAGRTCLAPDFPEATALGAALVAGLGSGQLPGIDHVRAVADRACSARTRFTPDRGRHEVYRDLMENAYRTLQEPLRSYRRLHAGEGRAIS